ncbi:hypothetical protein C8J56DRAFT_896107 [Mycena floridula]|nr:hypothetical protein C8J56DRAFT_896107 [Mycena floridula]
MSIISNAGLKDSGLNILKARTPGITCGNWPCSHVIRVNSYPKQESLAMSCIEWPADIPDKHNKWVSIFKVLDNNVSKNQTKLNAAAVMRTSLILIAWGAGASVLLQGPQKTKFNDCPLYMDTIFTNATQLLEQFTTIQHIQPEDSITQHLPDAPASQKLAAQCRSWIDHFSTLTCLTESVKVYTETILALTLAISGETAITPSKFFELLPLSICTKAPTEQAKLDTWKQNLLTPVRGIFFRCRQKDWDEVEKRQTIPVLESVTFHRQISTFASDGIKLSDLCVLI